MKTSSSKDRGRLARIPRQAGGLRSGGFPFRPANRSGMALVVTLAIVVLLTFLVVAFFSAATTYRVVENTSAGGVTAKILAEGAVGAVQAELVGEIIAGSTNTSVVTAGVTNKIYYPTTVTNMVPKRAVSSAITATDTNFANLVKQSGRPFYSGATIFGGTSTDSSTTASANGRRVGEKRWDAPMLAGANFATNQAPNWIYITPTGYTNAISDDVIGRVAFNVYDVGGLLNANVAGFAPKSGGGDPEEMPTKGSAVWADLRALPGINPEAFGISNAWPPKWRITGDWASFNSTDPESSLAYYERTGWRTAFLNAAGTASDRMFASRQDLIRYAKAYPGTFTPSGDIIPALQYFTTFSREIDAPSYAPDSGLPVVRPENRGGNDAAGTPREQINPKILELRVAAGFTRINGSAAKPGEPLLANRFPLERLKWVQDLRRGDASLATKVQQAFGLAYDSSVDAWTYNHGKPDGILRLSEVTGREPDFFELLKAAIDVGSLGKSAGANTLGGAFADNRDVPIHNQLIQIAANIIDQYDDDNFPTRIRFNGREFYGSENLPYLTRFRVACAQIAPSSSPNAEIGMWIQPEIWNPHGLCGPTPGGGPGAFRAVANALGVNANLLIPSLLPFPGGNINLTDDATAITWASSLNASEPVLLSTPGVASAGPLNIRGQPSGMSPPLVGMTILTWRQLTVGINPGYLYYTTSLAPGFTVKLQYAVNASGPWFTYNQIEDVDLNTLLGAFPSDVTNPDNVITPYVLRSDPRSDRFSVIGRNGANGGDYLFGTTMRPGTSVGKNGWAGKIPGPPLDPERGWTPGLGETGLPGPPLGTLTQNIVGSSYSSYVDADGVRRMADGGFASGTNGLPMVPGNSNSRPVILNRPFRSVAELGYAFRGTPWKSIDFFTPESGDGALLDYFCISERAAAPYPHLRAGTVNLNTPQAPVLAALLRGAAKTAVSATNGLNAPDSDAIASALSGATRNTPLQSLAGLPALAATAVNTGMPVADRGIRPFKARREAVVRALADSGSVRAWCFLIDIIAQSGIRSTTGQFIPSGESRYWNQVAIDRPTATIVAKTSEQVIE